MATVLTGSNGFLGWHTKLRAFSQGLEAPVALSLREDVADAALTRTLEGAERVIHVAGVNRAASETEIEVGNVHLAERLAHALAATVTRPKVVVFANSIQADLDNPYGRGKRQAATLLRASCTELGIEFLDFRLPNLFGEEGVPNYNSVVATFAHQVAAGHTPIVTSDRELTLMHAQAAARLLLEAHSESEIATAPTHTLRVSDVATAMTDFHEVYAVGEIPDLSTPRARELFNVYRSAMFSVRPVIEFEPKSDDRGYLVETMKSHGGEGQTFFSTTKPGITRGDHFHLRKVERFVVLSGNAAIQLRKMFSTDVLDFHVDGERPVAIDMPVGWVHNISNTGTSDVLTQFWTNEIFNPEDTDTFYEKVQAP